MKQFSPEAKHHILLEYRPYSRHHSLAALAARHAVQGGARTLANWYAQWDGTPQSLQRRKVPGRPRILSRAQVNKHVREPILAANRAHRPVHYTSLLRQVQRKTRKQPSLRTLRRYGKEELGAKQKHTTKRTADESEYMHTSDTDIACLCIEL
jgi:hypothetical protein